MVRAWASMGDRAGGFARRHLGALCVAALFGSVSQAAATCWEAAGQAHEVDPVLLKAIAWQESHGLPTAIGPLLHDGNRALGLMQINTVHLTALARWGIRRQDLFDACISQFVGAWILRQCIDQFGARWRAVGCYFAGPASQAFAQQQGYIEQVQRHYRGYALAKPDPVNHPGLTTGSAR